MNKAPWEFNSVMYEKLFEIWGKAKVMRYYNFQHGKNLELSYNEY
jgi:hypothetical protein